VSGVALMDVNAAFNNVSGDHMGRRIKALGVGQDLIMFVGSFMNGWQVQLVLQGETGWAHRVDTGIP
jgi:hypothetical protein